MSLNSISRFQTTILFHLNIMYLCVSQEKLHMNMFYEFINEFFVKNDKIDTFKRIFYLLKHRRNIWI